MNLNTTAVFFEIFNQRNATSGIDVKIPKNLIQIRVEVTPVGSNTYWQASSATVQLDAQIQLYSRSYRNWKYVMFKPENEDGYRLFEVHNTAKGESMKHIKLNLKELIQDDLKERVENVLQSGLFVE